MGQVGQVGHGISTALSYAHVRAASVSNVGMSFVMLIIKQHLHLETAIQKFFSNVFGQYRTLHLASSP